MLKPFVTTGSTVAMKGPVMFFLRNNTDVEIDEKNVSEVSE